MPLIYLEGRNTFAEIGEVILRETGVRPKFLTKNGARVEPDSRLYNFISEVPEETPGYFGRRFECLLTYSKRRELAAIDQDFCEKFGIRLEFFKGDRRINPKTRIGKLLPADHWAKVPHHRQLFELNDKLFGLQKKIQEQAETWQQKQKEVMAQFPWFDDFEYEIYISLVVSHNDWHYGDDHEIFVAKHELHIDSVIENPDIFFDPHVPDVRRLYSQAGDAPEKHSWLLYDLYDHRYIPREDLARIQLFWVEFKARHQRIGEKI